MSNALNDRLAARYSPKVLNELKTVKLTAAGLRDAEPDIYEWLVTHRGEEVQGILDAPAITAKRKAAKTSDELAVFYTECRNGKYSRNQIATWLRENFEDDFTRFNADYPQVAGEEVPSNMFEITADIAARRVFPVYAELVKSFGRLALPEKGNPAITLKCPDGEYRSGYELAQAIKRFPMELLEPAKQARPAYEAMSADEFLRTSPELQDNSQPALLKARFNNEFMRFLKSDVGRAWQKRMAEVNATEISTGLMWDLLKDRGSYTQKDFEDAAVASCDKFSVTLFHEDINGVRTQGLEIHDGGGNHHTQHSLGATMAGQIKPDAAEDTHVYGEAETRRLVRKLGSIEYRQLLNDSPNFRKAVDKYLGGA